MTSKYGNSADAPGDTRSRSSSGVGQDGSSGSSRFIALEHRAPQPFELELFDAGLESETIPAHTASNPGDDPGYAQQWWLNNTNVGQFDINVTDVWADYDGTDIVVTIIDDGVDFSHVDLPVNYDTVNDFDYDDMDFDPTAENSGIYNNAFGPDNHGMPIIGIIGAADNNVGVVGIAVDSTIRMYRRGNGDTEGNAVRDAAGVGNGIGNTNGNNGTGDVVSMSYGYGDIVYVNDPDPLAAFQEASEMGRGGLGTILVKSNGNSRGAGPDSPTRGEATANADESTKYTISVSALRADGWVTSYSSPGANLLVSAFGDDTNNAWGVYSTDRSGADGYNTTPGTAGDYTNFAGTSAAAPIVAGVATLVLDANEQLGWRDMQMILANSARHVGSFIGTPANTSAPSNAMFEEGTQLNGASWFWNGAQTWNGGGLHFSNDYGFGLVDAKAAVRLAETWRLQSTSANDVIDTNIIAVTPTVIDNSGAEFTTEVLAADAITIEHIAVELDFIAGRLADLEMFLVSPNGTRVQLIADTGDTESFDRSWSFGTTAFLGETSTGEWTVEINDDTTGLPITIRGVQVEFSGRTATDDDLVIITEEFSKFAGSAGHGPNFHLGAGVDVFNAAAVDSASRIDLSKDKGTVDGVAIKITGTEIVYTGDGNDTVIGDEVSTELHTGRGNDHARGGSSNEKLFGDAGNDTLNGGGGNDTLDGGGGTNFLLGDQDFDLVRLNPLGTADQHLLLNGFTSFPTDAFTIEFLVQSDVVPWLTPGFSSIVSYATAAPGNVNEVIVGVGDEFVEVYLQGVRVATSVAASALYDGNLHQVSVVQQINGGNREFDLWIDGVRQYVGTIANTRAFEAGGVLMIGQEQDLVGGGVDPNQVLNGSIGEIRIFDTARTASEVRENAFSKVQPTTSNLVANWSVDAANGTVNNLAPSGPGPLVPTGVTAPAFVAGDAGGNDLLIAGTGSDTLLGGGGNDTIIVSNDTNEALIRGGDGIDTIDFSGGTDFRAFLRLDINRDVNYRADVFGVENSVGSSLNDIMVGDTQANHFVGNADNDLLSGGAGNDTLDGGFGKDSLDGEDDDDLISGGFGEDNLNGGSGTGDTLSFEGDRRETIINLDSETALAASSMINLSMAPTTLAVLAAAEAGNIYINLLSTMFPSGELRGQVGPILTDTTVGLVRTVVFRDIILDSANQVPPVISDSSGFATLTMVDNNGTVTYSISMVTDLNSAAITAAHLHQAPAGSNGGVVANILGGGGTLTNSYESDSARNFENVIGGLNQDLITGNSLSNRLDGGNGGPDTLIGGAGEDTYLIRNVGDTIVETVGEGTQDKVQSFVNFALAADDDIEFLEVHSSFNTGTTRSLTGNAMAQTITGHNGKNTLRDGVDGMAGAADTMMGLQGDDTYRVNHSGTIVQENMGEGNDRVITYVNYALGAGQEVERLQTNATTGTNTLSLQGNELAQYILGNNGRNTLRDGADGQAGAADILIGLKGDDTYRVNNSAADIREKVGEGNDRVITYVNYALGAGQEVERLQTNATTGTNTLSLQGNELAQYILGNNGRNTLRDGADGQAGAADILIGLKGDDTYRVNNSAADVREKVGEGNDRVITYVNYALGAGQEVERLQTNATTGTNTLSLQGNELAQYILGNNGRNTLRDGADGQAGAADILIGLQGDDTYRVNNSAADVREKVGEGNDRVITYVNYALGAGQEVERLQTNATTGTADIDLTGNELAQYLLGNAGENYLKTGGGAADFMRGMQGDDKYRVYNTADSVVESSGQGTDRVYTSVNYALMTSSHVEYLQTNSSSGTSDIGLTGNELAQTIIGNTGDNRIDGKDGTDILRGLGGSDTFAFSSSLGAGNVDTVLDFNVADDQFELEDAVFSALSLGTLGVSSFVANVTGQAVDALDRVIYDVNDGGLLYDVDGVGGADAIQFASLSAGLTLSNNDFVIV
ncbi:S8 family serine peptidase [Phaeobacter gallaeciensis]|nr:S8 family serine peptidase [Phaeobacter gallaeciensis]